MTRRIRTRGHQERQSAVKGPVLFRKVVTDKAADLRGHISNARPHLGDALAFVKGGGAFGLVPVCTQSVRGLTHRMDAFHVRAGIDDAAIGLKFGCASIRASHARRLR